MKELGKRTVSRRGRTGSSLGISGDAALSSWIYRITFNTAMSRLRATRSTRMHEVTDEPLGTHDEAAPRAIDPADWSAQTYELSNLREVEHAD